jgi:type 2 lantibiotic biosynthesis protein LanM
MMTSPGAFSGLGGLIYTLSHLSSLLSQPELLQVAVNISQKLPARIATDDSYDIISGSAGAIIALLNLYEQTGDPDIVTIAVQAGDHLCKHADTIDGRYGWRVPGMGGQPLASMSHGSAGIAWALLRLAAVADKSSFAGVAYRAIADENNLFSAEQGNWADLREFEGVQLEGVYLNFWCHGAPGIGLARLKSLSYVTDASWRQQLQDDIQRAIKSTRENGFGYNHSLCHGDTGNLDFLLVAYEQLPGQVASDEITRFGSLILESMQDHLACGTPTGIETPGLMMGLAGMGYQMLRLASPARVPSLLSLEGVKA